MDYIDPMEDTFFQVGDDAIHQECANILESGLNINKTIREELVLAGTQIGE
jgi:hypothetical protein